MGYLLMLFSPPAIRFADAAADRFARNLPADNQIPGLFAARLIEGGSPKQLLGDWLMWRSWAVAAGAFLMVVAPWILYQKFYEPTGNRLIK